MLSRRRFLAGLAAAPLFARAGSVDLGVCTDAAHFDDTVRYGFDYCEPDASEVAAMEPARFEEFRAQVLASPIRCLAFRSFIRKFQVVGPNLPPDGGRAYVDALLGRCQALGGEVMVWGSSGSRNVPVGFSRDRAWEQIRDFLRMAGDVAARHRMVIAIEALRRQESNIINTSAEALRLVREVGHPQVKMIVDFYHLRQENEDPQIVWEARQEIVHLHFANPHGRKWPHSATEDPEYGRFFELVKKIGFRGGLSIEASGSFQADAAASLGFFAQMLG